MNQKQAIPFREEIPLILDLPKWAFMTSSFTWTSLYFVKFAFMYFFHALIHGRSKRVMWYFWTAVGVIVVCWLYSVVIFAIICPHFGTETGEWILAAPPIYKC